MLKRFINIFLILGLILGGVGVVFGEFLDENTYPEQIRIYDYDGLNSDITIIKEDSGLYSAYVDTVINLNPLKKTTSTTIKGVYDNLKSSNFISDLDDTEIFIYDSNGPLDVISNDNQIQKQIQLDIVQFDLGIIKSQRLYENEKLQEYYSEVYVQNIEEKIKPSVETIQNNNGEEISTTETSDEEITSNTKKDIPETLGEIIVVADISEVGVTEPQTESQEFKIEKINGKYVIKYLDSDDVYQENFDINEILALRGTPLGENINNFNTYVGPIENYVSGDWNSLSEEQKKEFSSFSLSDEGVTKITTNIPELLTELQSAETSDERKKEIQLELENKNSAIKKSNLFAALSILDESSRDALLNGLREEDCSGFFGTLGCFFGTKQTEEKALLEDLQKQNFDSSSIENYNQGLKKWSVSKIKNYLGDKTPTECEEDPSSSICSDAIQELSCDEADTNCQVNKEMAQEVGEINFNKKQIDTNIFFDIVSAITNPDYNAIKAAKLFGFESNFDNVPFFLKEEFPSQICIAKIEGYLDKERESGGGITKYGCLEDKEPYYDYDTGRLLNGVNPNCVDVIADIRAQRTQVTPDGRTSISYSYYLKAPRANSVTYLVAISYVQNGRTIKIPVLEAKELGNSSVGKGFEQVSIPLNMTEGINENSFQIGIISVFDDRRPYVTLTYPIVLIGDGDYYFETTEGTGNSNGNSQARAQAANPQENLDTQDLLQLFN